MREKFRGADVKRAWWRYERVDQLIKDFYADSRRQATRELDLGFPWRDGRPGGWSLRWLADTSELVGFHCLWGEAVWSTGSLGPIDFGKDSIDEIVVLLVERDEQVVLDLFMDRDRHLDAPTGWEWVITTTEGHAHL